MIRHPCIPVQWQSADQAAQLNILPGTFEEGQLHNTHGNEQLACPFSDSW